MFSVGVDVRLRVPEDAVAQDTVGALGVPVKVLVADGLRVRGLRVGLALNEYDCVILAESEKEDTEMLIPEAESVVVGLAEPEGLPDKPLRLLVAEREKDRVQVRVGASVGVSVGLRLWDGKVAVHEDSVGLRVTLPSPICPPCPVCGRWGTGR